MHPTLLLFDIDATLLKTGGAGMAAMANVAGRMFPHVNPFRWDGINAGGSLDPVIFAEAAKLNGIENSHANHSRFRDHYIDELDRQITARLEAFEVLPGVHDLLAHLREREADRRDIVLGLLTGNYTRAVPVKFKHAKLEQGWFSITAFGDEAATRPDLVALAMRKFEARHGQRPDPRRIIVIGDTPRDIHCAKAHGCVAFAVATGHHPAEELRSLGADVVVENLRDPSPLLSLLDD
jgi:phosphoglycolate phosphatase-like HAD superfamily hydrolase